MSDLPITIPPKAKRKAIIALKPNQVVDKKRIVYDFEGRFLESFGKPENFAKWFIKGPSYSGKSTLLFILARYLSDFGLVDYNSLEEGNSLTIVQKIQEWGLLEKPDGFRLLPKISIPDWTERLSRKRSAKFCICDSLQHANLTKSGYEAFVNQFANPRRGKSMLFICHWVNNDFVKFVKHDCDIKIEVIGYVAHIESRFAGKYLMPDGTEKKFGNKPFIIWEEEAKKYWGKKYKSVIEGKYWPGQQK